MDTRPEMRRVNLGAEWISIGYVEEHRVTGEILGLGLVLMLRALTGRAHIATHARNRGSEVWVSRYDVSAAQLLFQ